MASIIWLLAAARQRLPDGSATRLFNHPVCEQLVSVYTLILCYYKQE